MKEDKILHESIDESKRFNLRVFRAKLDSIEPKLLLKEIIQSKADVVIARIPVERQNDLNLLNQISIPYIVADTLVYYNFDLKKNSISNLRNKDIVFKEANFSDYKVLDDLVSEIFVNYHNHYSSNPLISKNLIPAYQEWVRNYASGKNINQRCWIVYKNEKPIAFATCAIHDDNVGEGVLYGVTPSASGSGVYGDIIRFTLDFYRSIGCNNFKVSTQIHNYAVQKVWVREGFQIDSSMLTIHLNPLLNFTKKSLECLELEVSEKEVYDYAEITGDKNSIHFSDEAAKNAGLSERIAHGLITNSFLSKYFGNVFPGNGTIFLGYTFKFLLPIFINKKYKVKISFPIIQENKYFYRAVAQIENDVGQTCLIAWCDLLSKNN